MSKRRAKLLLSLFASIMILGYWGFYEPQYDLPQLPADQADQQVDGFIIGAITVKYDLDGNPKEELVSERMTHYPVTDRTTLLKPELLIHRQNRSSVRVVADDGEVGPNNTEVILRHNVSMIEQQHQGFSMETDYLRMEPDNDYAETDAPVTLRHRTGEMRSIGMKAYLAEDRLQLLENVRGFHEPR